VGSGNGRRVDGTCYPACGGSEGDSDGDGWGWENSATCVVPGGAAHASGSPCDAGPDAAPGPDPDPGNPTPTGPRKYVGNITTQNELRQDFLQYWDQLTPENEGKWGSVEYTRDQMDWSKLDQLYRFARDNGIPFKQHTLVWGNQSPGWLQGLSQDEQRAETEQWIRLYCERFPDTEMIDVVNEPDHTTPSYIAALGGAGTSGHDWVIWSFETARRHCPNAELILNDYNVLRWDTDNFISIANKVKDAGYLDAVGCQAHGLEDIEFAELQQNLDRIAAIGVPVYVSEYDLDLSSDSEQAAVMAEQFPLFYEHPAVVGVTLWGYVHGTTWVPDSGLIKNGRPRPAMTWLLDYLGR
jgi:GH35 family endo-1,4-beta-xylanase